MLDARLLIYMLPSCTLYIYIKRYKKTHCVKWRASVRPGSGALCSRPQNINCWFIPRRSHISGFSREHFIGKSCMFGFKLLENGPCRFRTIEEALDWDTFDRVRSTLKGCRMVRFGLLFLSSQRPGHWRINIVEFSSSWSPFNLLARSNHGESGIAARQTRSNAESKMVQGHWKLDPHISFRSIKQWQNPTFFQLLGRQCRTGSSYSRSGSR